MMSKQFLRLSPLWYQLKFRPSYFASAITLSSKCDLSFIQPIPSKNYSVLKEQANQSIPETENHNQLPLLEKLNENYVPSGYYEKIRYMTIEELLVEAECVSTPEEADIYLGMLCTQVKLIEQTYKFAAIATRDIFADSRLEKILNFYDIKSNLPIYLWVNCMRSLLKLNSVEIHNLVTKVESNILNMIKDFSVEDLIKLNNVYEPHSRYNNERKSVYDLSLKHLEMKCTSVTKPKELVSLMYIFSKANNKDALDKLEEKCVKLVNTLKVNELYKVVFIASKTKRRNEPLLKAVTEQLNKCDKLDLSLIQLSKLLYACCTLNIINVELLDRICSQLMCEINNGHCNLFVLCSVVVSLGRLKWKDEELLESCLNKFKNKFENKFVNQTYMRKQHVEMKNVVKALATLDYKSQSCNQFVNKLASMFSQDKDNPVEWLDFVWSLVALQKSRHKHLHSVLNAEFVSMVSTIDNSSESKYKFIWNHQKLQNIDSAARHEISEYYGPYLPVNYNIILPKELIGCEKRSRDLVWSALNKMAPADKFLNSTESPGGYSVEAILNVNKEGKPRQLSALFEAEAEELHRICVKVQSFSESTLKTESPTGMMAMANRHLELMGFKVVIIPYSVLSGKPTVISIVQYIEQAINHAINQS